MDIHELFGKLNDNYRQVHHLRDQLTLYTLILLGSGLAFFLKVETIVLMAIIVGLIGSRLVFGLIEMDKLKKERKLINKMMDLERDERMGLTANEDKTV